MQHFKFKKFKVKNKYKRSLYSFQKNLLNLEIKKQHYKFNDLWYNLLDLDNFLELNLTFDLTKEFYETQKLRLDRIRAKNLDKKTKKLNNLYNEKYKSEKFNTDKGWFKNLSYKNIPQEVVNIVSLGDKFSYKQNISKKDKVEYIKGLETNIYKICPGYLDLQNEIQNEIRQKPLQL